MENAYNTALKIADDIVKEKFLRSHIFPGQISRKNYKNVSWKKIEKEFNGSEIESLKKDHQLIFEIVYPILQSV